LRLDKFAGTSSITAAQWTDLPVQVTKRQIASRAARFLGNLQAEVENGDY